MGVPWSFRGAGARFEWLWHTGFAMEPPTAPATPVSIRRASEEDAEGIVAVWRAVASARIYSAVDQPWTVAEERRYLRSLSPREAMHVAVAGTGVVVGFQSLDLYSPVLTSMAHVGQAGTFLLPDWRRRGIGNLLWQATRGFAVLAGYVKIAIQVRASNTGAQAFYRNLGFRECGRLARQVIIDGSPDDEILMELFL